MRLIPTFSLMFFFFAPWSWADKPPIVIGLNADMSAVAAEGGEAIRRGAQIAIDEINESGGLLGRRLALEVRDHRGNPARGLSNIKKFARDENVVAVLGGVHTPVVLHELEEVHKQGIVYLIPWAAGTPIVDNGFQPNYVFRLSVRDQHAGTVLLQAVKARRLNHVGLLLERTGWGRSNDKSMNAAAETLGVSVVATEWLNWSEGSMSSQIKHLIDAGAQAILLVANAPEGAIVVKNMIEQENDRRVPIFSHWGISGGAFVKAVGVESLKEVDLSVLQTYSFLAPSDQGRMQSLLQAYNTRFQETVTPETIPAAAGVVHAYDLVKMLALAVENSQSIKRAEVRNALEKIEQYDGVFKSFSKPFSLDKHDVLTLSDYRISRYNHRGYLIPVN